MVKLRLPKLPWKWLGVGLGSVALVIGVTYQIVTQNNSLHELQAIKSELTVNLTKAQAELADLKNQDQYKKNKELEDTIKNMEKTYDSAVTTYEKILDLNPTGKTAADLNKQLASALALLAKRNYASASGALAKINSQIDALSQAASGLSLGNVPANNNAPGSGYQRQMVHSDVGDFAVDIVAGDLGSTKVWVDTASDSDCRDNCPVLSLASYVSRTGAYAGVNGSYFCPAAYPSCAGKTNSFDTLLMNYKKKYFNSDNNVYSTVPAAIFGGGWIRFVGRSSDWGRDTGIDSMIANQPLLLSSGNIVFGGDGDPKKGSRGARSFVGAKGNTVYIGVAYNVTVAEMAHVLKTLGLNDALNLDSGGSTALWFGGYKVGPGRDIPNAVLFVRK
ncbi:phosphodiester glycosidase family protein [Candidatus Microgenomates bacterium]|nr:phosphodiester glycosidase family protein [Candidatus Microgenomates bacterium]